MKQTVKLYTKEMEFTSYGQSQAMSGMGVDFKHCLNETSEKYCISNFELYHVIWIGPLTFHSTFNALTVLTNEVS